MSLLAVAVSYLVGSIPTAFLVVKQVKQVDIRTVGSGNVGATNVTRVAGRTMGGVVFVLDLAKGVLAARVIAPLLAGPNDPVMRSACGLSAVVGHCFPLFLGFRGGKGVATTIGMLIGTAPVSAVVFLLVWGGCYRLTRYVSVGSLAAAATIPLTLGLTGRSGAEVALGAATAVLVIAKHHANIGRLRSGAEHRAGR